MIEQMLTFAQPSSALGIVFRGLRYPLKSILTFACVLGLSSGAWAIPLLFTVSNANQLMSVDVNGHVVGTPFNLVTKGIGVTQDAGGGPIRRIRGLAYDDTNAIMYGMTREGDLVDVNLNTGTTAHLFTLPPLPLANSAGDFWSGLAFDGTSKFYTTDAYGERLAEITRLSSSTFTAALVGSTRLTMVGSTVIASPTGRQVLGLDFYPASAPVPPPTFNGTHPTAGVLYGSNRTNDNIVAVDTSTGDLTGLYEFTTDVNNLQEIAFHPNTGVLYSIHDNFSTSNLHATLSTYDFSTGKGTELGELPFGIVEHTCCGNDTYGWGGLAFAPAAVPEPGSLLLLSTGLAGLVGIWSRRRGNSPRRSLAG